MANLTDKALVWIKKFGIQKDQIRETGLRQPHLSKLFRKGEKDRRLTLGHIEKIARKRRVRPSDIIRDIESMGTELEAEPQRDTLPVEEQAFITWQELFAHDGLAARRILKNLQQQQELGYTALISRVVRLMIEEGPQESHMIVAHMLNDFPEKKTKKLTKTRERCKKEFSQIR